MCLNRSKWGLAVLFLTKCTVYTHAAVTLWHQRESFKRYYQRNFHHEDGVFGAHGKPGDSRRRSSSIFNAIGLQQHKEYNEGYDCTAHVTDNASCDNDTSGSIISAQSKKIHKQEQSNNNNRHFVPRFSRLSKRLPSRPVDCCSECLECMSMESMEVFDCRSASAMASATATTTTLAVPRGGHIHTVVGSVATEAAANTAAITPYGLPLNAWKIIFQAILTTINVVCWLVPLKSKKISENKFGLSMANAFSGGVFLSLAFGHLIPECVHGFQNSGVGGGIEMNDALPYMIVLGGYLLIFFVEKVAFDAHEIMHEMEGGGGGHHLHHHDGHAKTAQHDSKDVVSNGSSSLSRQDSPVFKGRSAVILLGALAVHSILEMTALGLANTFGDSALLSLSIALHQPAESIALLVAFLKSGMPHPQIIQFLSIFSCMGPIGVAIGMAVNSFASPIVDATMLAVVAGTFVYVGATEVIPEEWEDPDHKWTKFVALLSGIVSIFAITQYTMTLEGGF
jgi:zinc transporter 1/2/3